MTWSIIFSILIGLIGIDILVIVHELGHFAFAKIFNVFVEKIQIGFGTSIATKVGKTGTEYSIGLIPYGAFCRMDHYSLESVKPYKRILIYLAGPVANIVFAILCYTIYLLMVKTNLFTALKLSTLQCINELKMFLFAIGDIITGQSRLGDTLSGFLNASINIGNIAKSGFAAGFIVGVETALWLSASVSISLAFANLIPIPALDGGFIFLNIIEMITRHRFSEVFQVVTQCIGLVLLLVVFPVLRMFF